MKIIPKNKSYLIRRSRYLAKRVLLVLVLILLLLLVTHLRLVVSTIQFFYKMGQLPPWPNMISEDAVETYPLNEEKQIARLLLEQTEQDRRRMIAVYQVYIEILSWKPGPGSESSSASKLFVLLRLLFDVPEEYPRDEARFFGGWIILRVHEDEILTMDAPTREDGNMMVNLLWPLTYENEQLVLQGTIFAYRGFPYDGMGEYDYFASHFLLRSVDELK